MKRRAIIVTVGTIAIVAAMLSVGKYLKQPLFCYGHQFGYRVQVDALAGDMTKNPYMKMAISETDKNTVINGRHIDTVSVVEAKAARYDLKSELPKRENEPRLGNRP